MKYLLVALMLIPTAASALSFNDITDAVTGHATDLYDRLTHDEMNIDGLDVATASFRTDDIGQDTFHWVKGDVSLVFSDNDFYIQLEDNFSASPAPDLYIYIANDEVVNEREFMRTEVEEIAKLSSGSGAQYYEIKNENVILDRHIEVVIWCKRFGEFMGAATLRKEE